jgi:polyisoprenoid-binding protein YceI
MPSLPPVLRRGRTWLIAVPVALLLAVVVGPFVYIHFIQGDPPAKLSVDDAVVPSTVATTTTAAAGASSTTGAATPADGIGVSGAWTVTSGSTAGYRAKEVLFGQDATAVGRTSKVSGTLEIAGTTVTATEVTVDMASVSSDESRRDGQFRGRIMSTDQFPTATFSLTKPIDLGSVPADQEKRTVSATGELTLRGVTRSVTVDLTVVRKSGAIVVNAAIPVSFDDYEIPNASGGPATVGRNGEIELLLVFAR